MDELFARERVRRILPTGALTVPQQNRVVREIMDLIRDLLDEELGQKKIESEAWLSLEHLQ
jgi:hypothetical protein